MISYDTPETVMQKASYIHENSLGGAMWWETSGDRPCSSGASLIEITANGLGGQRGEGLELSRNCLFYPKSRYKNLREGMPNE
jgi:chitinase